MEDKHPDYDKHYNDWKRTLPHAPHETIHSKVIAHLAFKDQIRAATEKPQSAIPCQFFPGKCDYRPPAPAKVPWELRAIAVILLLILLAMFVRPAHGQSLSSIQWQHNGSNITNGFFAYPFTINCSTNLNCTSSASVVTITATGGGGSGCVPPGTASAFLYDDGAGNCLDVPDFTFNGTHTITLGASGTFAITAGASVTGITAAMIPTLNQNTTGSAAKWTTARNLAGNSVDGSANVAFANKFIVQGTTDSGLSGAQFLGALGTGILKNTTTTGILSIAVGADLPTGIPIASVGSAGLSGTSPVAISAAGAISCSTCNTSSATVSSIATTSPITGGTITTTGTIACATCVVASSPAVGIAHFAGSTQTVTSSAVDLSGADATGTLATGRFPALTGDVTNSAGSLATTIAANAVTGAKMANATVTATQLAAQYSKGQCTELWGGSGTSFAMTSGDDAIANNGCYNDSGVTRTITAVKARSDNASNSTTVNPTFGAAGTGTTICSGALTAGNSYAYSSTCTVSNASWTTGTGIDPGMATAGNATSIALLIEYTF